MGQSHRLAAAVVVDRDQPVALELLQRGESGGGLEAGQGERLAERQPLQHRQRRRGQPGESSLDHLTKPGRRSKLPSQLPDAVLRHQLVASGRSQHQLTQREHVPATCPPELA